MTNETGAPGVVKCGICRHEMVQCDNGGFVCDHCCHEYDETCECAACLGLRINDRNEAELAALKSAPGMEEVDDIIEFIEGCESIKPTAVVMVSLFKILRRSIASREEVVGLLKWIFRNQENQHHLDWAILSDESRRILEIVEGK